MINDTDYQLASINERINSLKNSVLGENLAQLEENIATLNRRKLRYSPVVDEDVKLLNQQNERKEELRIAKETARASLDEIMSITLDQYQEGINRLLRDFGAQISIESLGFNYRGVGSIPRSEYKLKVRNVEVLLTGSADGATFKNTLSEGDKRSLAFAFFIARIQTDPKLSNKVLVIDDPMCSLDRGRRAATLRLIKELSLTCRQSIVLAHDAHFLRNLDDEITSLPQQVRVLRTYFKITTAPNNYSIFTQLNLNIECSSQYEKDLIQVTRFVNAEPGIDAYNTATRLRVLLESNLHRQYPEQISHGLMLGSIINCIAKASENSPLLQLSNNLQILKSLNDYARTFHHNDDGSPPEALTVDEGELRTYSQRMLDFIYRG